MLPIHVWHLWWPETNLMLSTHPLCIMYTHVYQLYVSIILMIYMYHVFCVLCIFFLHCTLHYWEWHLWWPETNPMLYTLLINLYTITLSFKCVFVFCIVFAFVFCICVVHCICICFYICIAHCVVSTLGTLTHPAAATWGTPLWQWRRWWSWWWWWWWCSWWWWWW